MNCKPELSVCAGRELDKNRKLTSFTYGDNMCVAAHESLCAIRNLFSGDLVIALRRLHRCFNCLDQVCNDLFGGAGVRPPSNSLVCAMRDIESARALLEAGDRESALAKSYAAYRHLVASLAQLV